VASTRCANSACAVNTCNAGFANCNGLYPDGCEINTTNDRNNCNGCGIVCANGLVCVNSMCVVVQGTSYSDTFTMGQTPTMQQCTNFTNFAAGLANNYTTMTISGTFDNIGITCNNPAIVQAFAAALKNNTGYISPACNGHTWAMCNTNADKIWLDAPSLCNGGDCPSPGYIIRPCIGNLNWGGVNTATCSAPTQVMTIKFQ